MNEHQKKNIANEYLTHLNAFISKTILDELVQYGIDQEYIFSFSVYMHIGAVKAFTKGMKNIHSDVQLLLSLLRQELNESVESNALELNDENIITALFQNNINDFNLIYNDIYELSDLHSDLLWIRSWEAMCNVIFSEYGRTSSICIELLKTVNEHLEIPKYQIGLTLMIIDNIILTDQLKTDCSD